MAWLTTVEPVTRASSVANAPEYQALMTKVASQGPDIVYMGAIVNLNPGKVLQDLRDQLEPLVPRAVQALSYAMSLINGSTVGDAVSAPHNAIEKLVEREKDNEKVVQELYYLILNRPPTEDEMKLAAFGNGESRLEAAQDVAWALMNSPAFLFNR